MKGIKTRRETGEVFAWNKYQYEIVTQEPVAKTTALFHFDGTLTDSVGSHTPSMLVGSQAYSDGKFEKGFHLNGGNAITIPYNADLNLDTNYTFECWFKLNSYTSGSTNDSFFLFGNPIRAGVYYNGFGVWFDIGYIKIAYGDGSAEKTVNLCSVPATGAWHHFSFNKSGTTITCYLDGSKVYSGTLSITTGTTAFLIGKSRDTAKYMNGVIDELIVVKGTTLRTGNFVPPARAFGDEYIRIGELVGLVKSLHEDAYPDGDVQNGYYYERVV